MAKKAYVGVGGTARNVKGMYVGMNGTARKVKKAYIGVNGVARLFWDGNAGGPLAAALQVGPVYGHAGTAFYFLCEASGGTPPYTYSYEFSRNDSAFIPITGLLGATPAWATFGSTGAFLFRATVTDSAGASIMASTGSFAQRTTNDASLNLTLGASRDGGTGVATWTLTSTVETGGPRSNIVVLKNGVYYDSVLTVGPTASISLPLTEAGTYTAIAGLLMYSSNMVRVVTGGQIVVT